MVYVIALKPHENTEQTPGDVTMGGRGGATWSPFMMQYFLGEWVTRKSCVHSTDLFILELFAFSAPLYWHHFFLRGLCQRFLQFTLVIPIHNRHRLFITRRARLSLLGRLVFILCFKSSSEIAFDPNSQFIITHWWNNTHFSHIPRKIHRGKKKHIKV